MRPSFLDAAIDAGDEPQVALIAQEHAVTRAQERSRPRPAAEQLRDPLVGRTVVNQNQPVVAAVLVHARQTDDEVVVGVVDRNNDVDGGAVRHLSWVMGRAEVNRIRQLDALRVRCNRRYRPRTIAKPEAACRNWHPPPRHG